MNVNEDLLAKLEKLSHIRIDESRRSETIEQLQSILSFVENLSELETDDKDTKFVMTDNPTQLREDTPLSKTAIADDILAHAPRSENHLFVVPKIIE